MGDDRSKSSDKKDDKADTGSSVGDQSLPIPDKVDGDVKVGKTFWLLQFQKSSSSESINGKKSLQDSKAGHSHVLDKPTYSNMTQ